MGVPVDPVAESAVPSGTTKGVGEPAPAVPLTRKVQAYNWIRAYIETTGHSPSMGDVALALGVSLSRAKALVHQLTREKKIERAPGAQRGISIPGLFKELVLKELRQQGYVVDRDITARPYPQEHLQLVALLEHIRLLGRHDRPAGEHTMTAPLDLLTGAQDAIIKVIRDQLPEAARGMVRHSLDEDFEPPFHLVGDISLEEAGSKHEQLDEGDAEIHTIYRGSDRRELLALMYQLRLATHDAVIPLGEAQYRIRWRGAIVSAAARDGVTYAGLTQLDLIAEPA